MTPRRKVLKNGLRIIAVPMKDNPTVTVMVFVEAGSHYEKKSNNGVSHFLEHMCFKGTTKRPSPIVISHELDALGSESNAFTWYEVTAYYAKSRVKNFKKILDVVADTYLNATVPEVELEKEKGVIIEEINMYEDMPIRNVHRLLDKVMYGDQPAGWSVLGTKENIRKITRDEFVAYRTAHYVAKKTTVVVAGDIDAGEVLRDVEQQFKTIRTDPAIKKPRVRDTQRTVQCGTEVKKSDQSHFVIGFRTFPVSDTRTPALEILTTLLGRGMSSRLFKRLRDDMGVCYYVRADSEQHSDHGKFTISSGVDNTRVPEVLGVIAEELRNIRSTTVSMEEFTKAQEFTIGNFLMNLESSDEAAQYYGFQEVLHLRLKKPEEVVRKLKAVTPGHVQKLARELFTVRNANLALIGPKTNARKLTSALKL